MSEETYEAYTARMDAINKSRQTNPPTCPLDYEFNDGQDCPHGVTYGDDTEVQWRCPCGCESFRVFYEEGNYRTYVKCQACGKQSDVHTG